MGILDRLLGGKGAVMSAGAYWNLSDDKKKLAICQEAGQRMAPIIGGSVKVRDDGDEVHVTGRYGPYPVRMIIWVTFANLRIQVKPTRKLTRMMFGGITLKYDAEAPANAGEQLDRDEWDQDEDKKLFLSPHVLMEGSRDDLREAKTRFDQLPPDLTGHIVQMLGGWQKDGTYFAIRADEIELYLNDSRITLSSSPAEQLQPILDLFCAVAAAAEQRWTDGGDAVAATPIPVPGAPPAGPPPGSPPPGAAGAVLAPGTPVLVAWSDGNRYPATVVQVAQGQVLCAFPDGQQQWIANDFVSRTA